MLAIMEPINVHIPIANRSKKNWRVGDLTYHILLPTGLFLSLIIFKLSRSKLLDSIFILESRY